MKKKPNIVSLNQKPGGSVGFGGGVKPQPRLRKGKPGAVENAYRDAHYFLIELQRRIGANVIISLILDDGDQLVMVSFHRVPKLEGVRAFKAAMTENDFVEPTEHLTMVIVDAVHAYMAEHGWKKS